MNSLHRLLNCEIGGLAGHVITTEYRTRAQCIHTYFTMRFDPCYVFRSFRSIFVYNILYTDLLMHITIALKHDLWNVRTIV